MDCNFKDYLLDVTKAVSCEEVEVIQTLWSGYGKIARYRLTGAAYSTVVVKHISWSGSGNHPRGWNTDRSHARKIHSYKVETHWYQAWSQHYTDRCRIPKYLGSFTDGKDQWIILEDLNPEFPGRKEEVDLADVKVCLEWLAHFHAQFMGRQPNGLWEVGTYWHLETRPDERDQMAEGELKDKADAIDDLLNKCKYQTIVHGDAKLANFCFAADGVHVAAVDFQYVGGGCGMKDVAYFLGSCLSGRECEVHETALLNFYFKKLRTALTSTGDDFNLEELEQEWRSMYPLACADFMRFLLGWMPGHQKINDYNRRIVESVLADL